MFASEVKLVSLSSKDSPKNCFRTQSSGLVHNQHQLQKYNHNNNLIGNGGNRKKQQHNNNAGNSYGLYNNRKKYYNHHNNNNNNNNINNNNIDIKNQNLDTNNYNHNNSNNHTTSAIIVIPIRKLFPVVSMLRSFHRRIQYDFINSITTINLRLLIVRVVPVLAAPAAVRVVPQTVTTVPAFHFLYRGFNNHRGSFRGRRNIYSNPRTSYGCPDSPNPTILNSTPPDRFLARAHLIEVKEPPIDLLNGGKWDTLSQSIWNKFLSSQQTAETYKKKMMLWKYLYLIIKKTYPRFGLYLVGSTISGFGADTSDVDMCLVSRTVSNIEPRVEALFNLTLLRDCLSSIGDFENFNLIEAKVPILRFRDKSNLFEVDLNFNNCVGIKNTHLLYCYSQS
uniref:Poly(A) RNA polymerase mitochondrial-like central palm domain-containing protein n=1 Tax=Megaselia scalaris TaxID=36166 RepID=T1H0K5_MEGSC